MKKKWYNYFVVTGRQPEADSPAVTASPSPPRRVIDVAPEIESDTPQGPAVTAAASDPGVFDEIYQSARIETPQHGYSVLKVAEMLQSEHIHALPADVKRKSILVALDAAGVKVDDIVSDAVRRDRALDTYERVLQKQLETLRSDKERENAQIEAEIDERLKELRKRIEENNTEISREQDQLLAWQARKREEESKISEAIGYFVSENPITTSVPQTHEKGGAQHVRQA